MTQQLPLEPAVHEPDRESGSSSGPQPLPWWRRISWSWIWPWVGLGWMVGVLLVGLPMVARIAGEPLLGEAFRTFWTEQYVHAAALTYAVVLVPSLLAWLLRRDFALLTGLVASLAVVLAVGDNTGSLAAVVITGVQALVAWFVGLGLISLVIAPGTAGVSFLARTVVAFALGNGLLGLAYLGLGAFGLIGGASLALTTGLLVVASAAVLVLRGRRGFELPRLYAPSLLETVLIAGALAFATWALLHAYVPEVLSDAVRGHLPITREIWQGGAVPELVNWTSRYPIHAQLITVPVWAVGGMAGVALTHGLVGLMAALGAASLADLLAGRRAAAVAFAAFVSAPLVLWELGHSYVDHYPALFVVAGAVTVVLWQRLDLLRILFVAGFLVGLAFASKVTSAPGVGALGLAVLLVGRGPFSWRSRLYAGLAVVGGGLLTFPWLWRSYLITGQFPGLDLLLSSVLGTERQTSVDLATFGVGRGPLDLLSIPWAATFQGELFGQNGAGALGLLLLMAAPLVVFAPRSRSLAFVVVLIASGILAWAFTAQYFRYALPLVAVLAALAGVGVSSLAVAFERRGPRFMATVVVIVAILAIALSPLISLPARRNQVPFEFYTGELDGEAILIERINAYQLLQAADEIVGADEPLLWVGGAHGGVYTETDVVTIDPRRLGDSNAEVLDALEERGIEYLLWERDGSSPNDWSSRLVSPAFLRDHSTLVLTGDRAYLFRLGEDQGWEQGPRVLPELEGVGPGEDWVPRGDVVVGEEGVVIPAGGNVKATAPVEAGATYIVRVRASCEDRGQMIVLTLWKSAENITIGRDRQRIIPPDDGPTLALVTAVDDAEAAVVHVASLDATCIVTSITMRQLINAPDSDEPGEDT